MVKAFAIFVMVMSCSEVSLDSAVNTLGHNQAKSIPASGSTTTSSPSAGEESTINAVEGQLPSESESPVAPVQITGAFLHCVTLLTPVTEVPTTVVGCRLEDAKGGHIAPETSDVKEIFVLTPSTVQDVSVSLKTPVELTRRYDAIIESVGKNAEVSQRAAQESGLELTIQDMAKGSIGDSFSGAIQSFLAPIVDRGQWKVFTNPGGSLYVDETTSLTWSVDDQILYTREEAITQCEALNYGNKGNWRLPNIAELKLAALNGLGRNYSEPQYMNIASQSIYWSSSGLAPAALALSPVSGEAISAVASTRYSSLCVSDDSNTNTAASTALIGSVPCGGEGDSCYDNASAMSAGLAITPKNKAIEYVLANGAFYVWKEVGGERVLKANGSDRWARSLRENGKGFSDSYFTSWSSLVGRKCPPSVFIDNNNKFSTNHCLYYTSENQQPLDSNGSDGSDGIKNWTDKAWYVGNIKVCSKKGMRLPTIFETATTKTSSSDYPTSDGEPIFAKVEGIPSNRINTWTATSSSNASSSFWFWSATAADKAAYGNNHAIRCVLP